MDPKLAEKIVDTELPGITNIYKEKVVIPESKISVSLIGEDGAILTNDDFAAKKNYFGEEMSTSGSSTCYIYAPDFYAENITFENSAGRDNHPPLRCPPRKPHPDAES